MVFQLALTLSSSRVDVTTASIMSNLMTFVSISLFNEQGPMRKCVLKKVLKQLGLYDAASTVLVRDVMSLIYTL